MSCEHEWDDDRPTVLTSALPPAGDGGYAQCKKCGAPLQLPRRTGMWMGTPYVHNPDDPGNSWVDWGPPFYYMDGKK